MEATFALSLLSNPGLGDRGVWGEIWSRVHKRDGSFCVLLCTFFWRFVVFSLSLQQHFEKLCQENQEKRVVQVYTT